MQERYEIRVRGHLSPAIAASFDGLFVSPEPAETVLHGALRDQEELFGLLDRLQALGLDLVEVRRLASGAHPLEPPVWRPRITPEE